jgi:hypothetical protein
MLFTVKHQISFFSLPFGPAISVVIHKNSTFELPLASNRKGKCYGYGV